jgi:hypothetical protein
MFIPRLNRPQLAPVLGPFLVFALGKPSAGRNLLAILLVRALSGGSQSDTSKQSVRARKHMTAHRDVNTAVSGPFSVEEVLSHSSRWDKKIATDLISEMEFLFGEKVATLPQMRNILAVKGYRGLRRRITRCGRQERH